MISSCLFRNLVYLWLILLTAWVGCFVNLPIQQTLLGTMHSDWINVIVKHQANTLILFQTLCQKENEPLYLWMKRFMYMYFGFDFFQIGNHTKNDCPLSIISCPFLSVGCDTKVCLLHFLNQSLFILLTILLFSVLLFEQTPGGRGLALPTVPFVGSLHFTPSARPNLTVPP